VKTLCHVGERTCVEGAELLKPEKKLGSKLFFFVVRRSASKTKILKAVFP
jgi:hypothetical protein